jgi:hypothetical protein
VIDQVAGDGEGVFADDADGQAVGERGLGLDAHRPARRECRREAGGVGRLDADHLHFGIEVLDGGRHASNQAAAANGNDDRIQVRHLLDHFQPDRPLAGNDPQVVVAVNVSELLGHGQLVGLGLRLAEAGAVQDHRRSQPPAVGLLHQRGIRRHDDGHRNAELAAVRCQGQGVVAGAGGHDTPFFLRLVELQ